MVLPCFLGDTHPVLVRVSESIAELTQEHWLVTHRVDRHRPNAGALIDRLVSINSGDADRFAG